MIFAEWPGFSPQFLVCAFGHNHGDHGESVVGLEAERYSLGKEKRPTFHCELCGIIQGGTIRSEIRPYPTIQLAVDAGNILPCGICFRDLNNFVGNYLLRQWTERRA